VLPVQKNGKTIVGEAEQPEIYCQNMDLDVDLESIFCNLDHPAHTIQHAFSMDMVGTNIFYED